MRGFQSFCIVGFLWKRNRLPRLFLPVYVSILLYRWIPLEEGFDIETDIETGTSFNPSVSLDSSGSFRYILKNGITVSFNPSVSLDSSGSRGLAVLLLPD